MKFLVLFSIVASAVAVPISPGYGTPVAPIETVSVPVAPTVIEQPQLLVRSVAVPFPLQPTPLIRALPAQPAVQPVPLARALPVQHAVPAPLSIARAAAPVGVPAALPFVAQRVVPTLNSASSQFQAQDELGGFAFGYINANSAKNEVRSPDGVTRGFYEYVDANNILQRVEYISDDINGFRVAGTNIPVAGGNVVLVDTPEVTAAKIDFQRAFDAAIARNAAAIEEEVVVDEEDAPVKVSLAL